MTFIEGFYCLLNLIVFSPTCQSIVYRDFRCARYARDGHRPQPCHHSVYNIGSSLEDLWLHSPPPPTSHDKVPAVVLPCQVKTACLALGTNWLLWLMRLRTNVAVTSLIPCPRAPHTPPGATWPRVNYGDPPVAPAQPPALPRPQSDQNVGQECWGWDWCGRTGRPPRYKRWSQSTSAWRLELENILRIMSYFHYSIATHASKG